jgi:hypothetical protein
MIYNVATPKLRYSNGLKIIQAAKQNSKVILSLFLIPNKVVFASAVDT